MSSSEGTSGNGRRERDLRDEEFFELDPNAARFRDLAHTLLREPGATKENVRKTLIEYGVGDEVMDRIFHTKENSELPPQQQQLQQQAQGNPAGEDEGRERQNEIRETALKLAEIRERGNKGTQFLRDLKKQLFTSEEIAQIDALAGEPSKRVRTNKTTKKPLSNEAQMPTVNQTKIDRVREVFAEGKDPIEVLQTEGWSENDIQQAIHGLHEQLANESPVSNTDHEDAELVQSEARQVLRDRENGKSKEEITELMKKVGYTDEKIAARFRVADSIAKNRKTEGKGEIPRNVLRETAQQIVRQWEKGISSDQIEIDLKASGWKGADIPEVFRVADMTHRRWTYDEAASLNPAYEAPVMAGIKRTYDPIQRFLNKLSEDKQLGFQTHRAYLTYGVSRESGKKDDANPVKKEDIVWQKAYNYHDFLRLCQGPLKGLHTRISVNGRNFLDRLTDPKDPLHSYEEDWNTLRNTIRRSERGELPRDEYARAVLRGEVEIPDITDEEAWEPLVPTLPTEDTSLEDWTPEVPEPLSAEDLAAAEIADSIVLNSTEEPMAAALEQQEQDAIDARIEGEARAGADEALDTPLTHSKAPALSYEKDLKAHTTTPKEDSPQERVMETGTHKKWGEFEDIDYTDMPSKAEGTPKEWREKLRSLIEGAKDKMGAAKEKVDWWKSAEEGLIRRSAELDAEAEKIGWLEGKFRGWGESYNKLSFTKKVLLGAGLGLGAVATAGSLAVVFPMLGIAAQRAAGFSTMYLKFEKKWHDEAWGKNKEWGKQKALLSAGLYTVLLGLTMKEAIEYASDTEIGHALQAKTSEFAHATQEKVTAWLGSVLHQEYDQSGNPILPEPATPASTHPMVAPGSVPAGVQTPETVVVPPEAMKIDVAASKGHGYEYMTKRLWEQLQEKHIKLPSGANPESDLARLLRATPEDINKVVHDLATENRFFHNADGTSVLLTPDSHIGIDSNGNILIHGNGYTPEGGNLAPTDAAVTPAYHPEGTAHVSGPSEGITETETVVPTPAETPFFHPDAPVAEAAAAGPAPLESGFPESGGTHPSTEAVSNAQPPIESHSIVNGFGVDVSSTEAKLYSDGKDVFVYGGTSAEQVKEARYYLLNHPKDIVYGTDDAGKYRIPLHLLDKTSPDGTLTRDVVPSEPVTKSGFLWLKSFVPPPNPHDFKEIIH